MDSEMRPSPSLPPSADRWNSRSLGRRNFVRTAGGMALAGTLLESVGNCSPPKGSGGALPQPVKLPSLFAPNGDEETMPAPLPPDRRIGLAVVGLGHLSLEEILPALRHSNYAKVTALVSGDGAKAARVAQQYGVSEKSIYSYQNYDRLADNREVDAVYIVLPNNLHVEYTVRAARAGKHVLCEKPMANSVVECTQMIDACRQAERKLMIAYRMQYEPNNRAMIRLVREKKLGELKLMTLENHQNQGSPTQWRLKKALAGGGALPDIGIYCLNAARYLTGEEPVEVSALLARPTSDPRFREVEEAMVFSLRFPNGAIATASTSYAAYATKRYQLVGTEGRAEMDPAFAYRGLRLRVACKGDDGFKETVSEWRGDESNQFAVEMDHFVQCILQNRDPHTPGEEGRQDVFLMETIYRAAAEEHPIRLEATARPDAFRGPVPT